MPVKLLFAPLLSIILLLLGSGFFMTFISIRLKLNFTPETTIGLIHSAYYAGLIVGALSLEKLITAIGHIRAFATFASITTLTILLQGMSYNNELWVLVRFIAGASFAALYISIESWLLVMSNKNTRGKILALYMAAFYSAQAAGQFILDFINLKTLMPFLVAASLCSLSIIPVAITFHSSPTIHKSPKIKIMTYFKKSPFGFLGCFTSGLIIGAIYSFLPNFSQDNNISTSNIMFLTISGGFILQWPIGIISDRYERHKILTYAGLLLVLPCLILGLTTLSAWLVYVLCFFIGGLCFVIYPISIAKVCDHIEHEKIISATSVLLLINGIGSAIGPYMVSVFISWNSSSSLFIFIAFVATIISISGLYIIIRGPSQINKGSSEFYPLPNLTPVGNELDPRT